MSHSVEHEVGAHLVVELDSGPGIVESDGRVAALVSTRALVTLRTIAKGDRDGSICYYKDIP